MAPEITAPHSVRIFRAAVRTGWADFRQRYTIATWTFGWLLRCLAEVVFFGLIGVLVGDATVGLYLLVGRAFFLGTQEVMWVIQAAAWEKNSGTLPLLVSAPGRDWLAFAGRGLQFVPSATLTSLIALLGIAPLFGHHYDAGGIATVVLAVPVSVLASYGFALPLAAVVLSRPAWRNMASNLTHSLLGLLCGVFVPVAFWPTWMQVIAQGLPITHALDGLRRGLAGNFVDCLPGLGLAVLVGAAWLALGAWLTERFAEHARRDGTIDLDQ